MTSNEEKILDLCTMTGIDPDTAHHLLEASNWNMEKATNLFFDGGTPVDIKETITAPIPQKKETLIQEERKRFGFNPDEVMEFKKPKTKFDKIFAPPQEIMFFGTFEQAREKKHNKKRK